MASDFPEFEQLANCPVCGTPGPFEPVSRAVVRCPSCRVCFADPRPTQASIVASYESGATFDSWVEAKDSRRQMWLRRVKLMGGDLKGKTLLDIGTGDGHFLTVARELGMVCLGTEMSQNGASRAIADGHKVLMGQFSEIDFHGQQFDFITMWHVLEHVPNPGETLRKIRTLLKPGGRFLVAVPDEDNAFVNFRLGFRPGKEAPISPPKWGHEIHLTYFQPGTLRNALQRAGMKVKKFGVDDIYGNRSARNMAVLTMQKTLAALFQWHFSIAMYAICGRDDGA